MIRCLVRELCSMRKITGQTQHPPCSYIIVSQSPPETPCNLRSDILGLLCCYCSLLEDKCLYCLVSPGSGSLLSIYTQLISLPIKVMKQSAAAFISLAPTDISWVDDRTTGFQHQTTIKLVALLFLT